MADSERALEGWVRSALTNTYGDVADERVPDDWLRLIEDAVEH